MRLSTQQIEVLAGIAKGYDIDCASSTPVGGSAELQRSQAALSRKGLIRAWDHRWYVTGAGISALGRIVLDRKGDASQRGQRHY